MNYQAIYNALIERAKTREIYLKYTEMHHIIPRSEGGSNKKENKVEVTQKEHHLLHLLLLKMGRCLKYCYVGYTLREYVKSKMKEKAKKHLLSTDEMILYDYATYKKFKTYRIVQPGTYPKGMEAEICFHSFIHK